MAKFFCRAKEKENYQVPLLISLNYALGSNRRRLQWKEQKKIQQKKKENYANFFSATAADLVWKFVRTSPSFSLLWMASLSPHVCYCPLCGALCDLLARLVKSCSFLEFANNRQYIKSVFSLDLKTIERRRRVCAPYLSLSHSLSVSLLTFHTIFKWKAKCAPATSKLPFLSLFLHFFNENMSSKVENELKLRKAKEKKRENPPKKWNVNRISSTELWMLLWIITAKGVKSVQSVFHSKLSNESLGKTG